MNERIKELGLVATQFTNDTVPHLERVHNRDYDFDEIDEIYNQKFAELIVKECRAMAIQKLAIGSDKYTESHNGSLWSVINEIDEHFGVEE